MNILTPTFRKWQRQRLFCFQHSIDRCAAGNCSVWWQYPPTATFLSTFRCVQLYTSLHSNTTGIFLYNSGYLQCRACFSSLCRVFYQNPHTQIVSDKETHTLYRRWMTHTSMLKYRAVEEIKRARLTQSACGFLFHHAIACCELQQEHTCSLSIKIKNHSPAKAGLLCACARRLLKLQIVNCATPTVLQQKNSHCTEKNMPAWWKSVQTCTVPDRACLWRLYEWNTYILPPPAKTSRNVGKMISNTLLQVKIPLPDFNAGNLANWKFPYWNEISLLRRNFLLEVRFPY